LGIAVSFLVLMPFSSGFSYKGLSLGLGMLVAYQRWLVPSSAVSDRHDEPEASFQNVST